MSVWSEAQLLPPDAILGLKADFDKDTHKDKVYLGVGAYRDENGKPYILKSVIDAEKYIFDHPEKFNHEYIPIDGYGPFRQAACEFMFGEDRPALKEGRIYTSQSISGSGALCIALETLKKIYKGSADVYIPNPTWANHIGMAGKVFGAEHVKKYTYLGSDGLTLDFAAMSKDIKSIPDGSIVLLHMCAHNPTGVDLSKEQWTEMAELLKEKHHMVIMDGAYQGFASGDFVRDAYSLRLLTDAGIELIACQSFAKNMGLYGERCGAVHFVVNDKEILPKLVSNVKVIIRQMYSSPPCHGAFIASLILTDKALRAKWCEELVMMAERIIKMRKTLRFLLEKEVPGRDWSHITSQIGMFSYSGLTVDQVLKLRSEFGVYMTNNGRISMACLNEHNVEIVAKAIKGVLAE